jgi:hypothetical protein
VEVLNGTWSHYYEPATQTLFTLLGHAGLNTNYSYGWMDARAKCASLGPHFQASGARAARLPWHLSSRRR